MKEYRIGVIGNGNRGKLLTRDVLLQMDGLSVVNLCDYYEDRVEEAADIVRDICGTRPATTTDYRETVDDPNVDVVVIASAWENHVDAAVYAMNAGKPVAMEVGGAYAIKDCWRLVDTYEATKTPFMFLENICFARRSMMVQNMVKQGVFGKLVHCSGCYAHDLREEITGGYKNRHYRLRNYLNRCAENYPTHDVGPLAKMLNVNHGNRFLSLTSTASCAAGLKDYIRKHHGDDQTLTDLDFKQGDVVTTVIKCAHGETVALSLDTSLPRYYSMGLTVRGTGGMYQEDLDTIYLDRPEDHAAEYVWRKEKVGNAEEYAARYESPEWREQLAEGAQGAHDGADWMTFKVFFRCLREGRPMPVDVYDAATWMAITALSEQSIAMGSAPVAFPDFTRGKWIFDTINDA